MQRVIEFIVLVFAIVTGVCLVVSAIRKGNDK